MSESAAFKVRIIDYKLYKTELLELRRHSWLSSSSNVDSEKLISKKDDVIDIKAIHCGVFENQKLIASHRLQPITNIKDLPFSNHFETSKIVDSNWYTYGTDGTDYVKMATPVVSTGRMVIHPDFRKQGISKQILNFWIEYSKNNNIKSLLSFPSPWMLNSLLDLGFSYEKILGKVFAPVPSIDITLVIKKF